MPIGPSKGGNTKCRVKALGWEDSQNEGPRMREVVGRQLSLSILGICTIYGFYSLS